MDCLAAALSYHEGSQFQMWHPPGPALVFLHAPWCSKTWDSCLEPQRGLNSGKSSLCFQGGFVGRNSHVQLVEVGMGEGCSGLLQSPGWIVTRRILGGTVSRRLDLWSPSPRSRAPDLVPGAETEGMGKGCQRIAPIFGTVIFETAIYPDNWPEWLWFLSLF